jgi:hypothetical protein
MRCPNCDSENYEPTRFCIECGAAFKRSCPKCGSGNLPQAKFCGDCGVTLAADGVQSLTIPRAPVASTGLADAQADISAAAQDERKTVTALFADIKGSTELMEDLDPEEARAIIDPALKIMVEAVRRYEGYVVQSTGDGIFALFGAPVAMRIIRNARFMPPSRCNRSFDALSTRAARTDGVGSAHRSEYRRSRSTHNRDRRQDGIYACRAYSESRLGKLCTSFSVRV